MNMSNNNGNIETSAELRRSSMLITPSKRSVTRGIKTDHLYGELRRSSTYNGLAQAVELLRSSIYCTLSVSPSCTALTRGYQRLTPTELSQPLIRISNNNSNIETSAEIRRISMWITPSYATLTRATKPSISSELRRSYTRR